MRKTSGYQFCDRVYSGIGCCSNKIL